MIDEIYLKCSLCSDAHSYQLADNFVVAIESEWKSVLKGEYLLSKKPENGEEYELIINGPLKLSFRDNFWSIYMSPNAQLNGIEDESDIASISFCLNKPLEVISLDEMTATLKIKVVEVIEMSRSIKTKNPDISWMGLLKYQSESKTYYQIENYSRYSLININIQSDLGLVLIIEKDNYQSWIVAVNEWDFHKNLWYTYSKELTKEEEIRYGIQHKASSMAD
ncbi:hypothetical protein [Fulvivirga sediminis]|uniref:Uncharacterized protein n=1 Tax=Fulvivirga sediminis TaxID=2803949 RepID=A0A937FB54_9BACT|nr:hypothetical protein [Fulvivirga sediminis]MBL3659000.1 hypothetical protein [Fulvivirga sediminis]